MQILPRPNGLGLKRDKANWKGWPLLGAVPDLAFQNFNAAQTTNLQIEKINKRASKRFIKFSMTFKQKSHYINNEQLNFLGSTHTHTYSQGHMTRLKQTNALSIKRENQVCYAKRRQRHAAN